MLPRGLLAAILAGVLLVFAAGVRAQDAPDYAAWEARAAVAETIADRAQASSDALEALRVDMAGWRDRFLAAQDANAARIATLEAQIEALGPAPDEGESEPDDIADRRAELSEQLQALRAPVRRAEEAYTRADGIIAQIDAIIRSRQTEALLELGPSPLNPVLWGPAIEELVRSLTRSWRELSQRIESDVLRAQTRANLPVILGLLAVGVLLIARGRAWSLRAVEAMRGQWRRGSDLGRFLLSMGQVILPLVGIYALVQAAFATELLGTRLADLLERLPLWAAILLGTWWLTDRALNDDDAIASLRVAPDLRRRARASVNALAVLLVLNDILRTLGALDGYSDSTVAVLNFPLLVLAGAALVQLGRLSGQTPAASDADVETDTPEPGAIRLRLARLMARSATLIGVAGPVFAALGYQNVGNALVYPAIVTLMLFGLVITLQHMFDAVYGLATGRSAEESDSLAPVLAGLVLAALSVPVLALIWGARVADLTELWTRFTEGFELGNARIAPTDFLVVLAVFLVGLTVTRLVQGALRGSVLPRTRMEPGAQTAIVSGIGYVGIAIAALIAISAGGLDLSSLAIVAGALSVGIGFGLRTVVENFVSGILLLIERPISEGDWIEVGGQHGIVKAISVRATRIETFDKFDLIVPNADLISGQVRNYTRGNVLGRVIVPVGVAYGSDTRKVESVLLDIARQHRYVLMNPEPYVYFKGFGADSMDFEIRAILSDVTQIIGVTTDMNHQIVERFAEAGIAIPFPQRDVWLRNPEALRTAPPADTPRGNSPDARSQDRPEDRPDDAPGPDTPQESE